MQFSLPSVPEAINEPVYSYAKGSKEREQLHDALKAITREEIDAPMYIGGKEVRTGNLGDMRPPHNHGHLLGQYHIGEAEHVTSAINAALAAGPAWAALPFAERASIILKAADLVSNKYRYIINAATMEGQSKNAYQAEIDAACELADFFRFNVAYAEQIYADQPYSPPGMWNRLEYRPLEGFVLALTPFNFTAIAGNLPTAPALMGNTVVWKCSDKQVFSANVIMKILMEAGMPAGVINLIHTSPPVVASICLKHPNFAGMHYTGSSAIFKKLWVDISANLDNYKSYPRIVGEAGGKDYILIHQSADPLASAVAMVRGAFEYQGQKCSAASRVYVPSNLWPDIKDHISSALDEMKMGRVSDFSNFINAVIDEVAFDRITGYVERAHQSKDAEVVFGGEYDKSQGYFIQPTVILAKEAHYESMREEIFGPVLTVYVYEPKDWKETIELVDSTSVYALTGAVISQDRAALYEATELLRHSAGNFYLNDKPTGAVVGQQPFGGGRASGTNDKAGSYMNLIRWVSPRNMKETFVMSTDWRYPFLG